MAIYILIKNKFLHKVRLFEKIECLIMRIKNSIEIDSKLNLCIAKKI